MFPTVEFVKTIINGLQNRIEKVEKRFSTFVADAVPKLNSLWSTRPNWEQNDPEALDYVKGRTHWEEESVIDISGKEYTITGFTSSVQTVAHDEIPLELGQTWSVKVANQATPFEVEVQQDDDGILYLGTPTLNDYPFYITKDATTINSYFRSVYNADSLTLVCTSGSVTSRIVHPLDPKFLPIPATASVGQVLVVKAIDENGKPTEFEAVDISTLLPQ